MVAWYNGVRNESISMNRNEPKWIVIHTSDVATSVLANQFNSINRYHEEQGFPKSSLGIFVGYHRLIDNGKNIHCRLDTDEGAHCNERVDGISMNFQSLGICVSFDGDIEPMKPKDYELLKEQVRSWQDQYDIPDERVKFHRDFKPSKTCPGLLITEAWKQKLLERAPLPTYSCVYENEEIERLKSEVSMWKQAYEWVNQVISRWKW